MSATSYGVGGSSGGGFSDGDFIVLDLGGMVVASSLVLGPAECGI